MELVGHARPVAGLWLCTVWFLPLTGRAEQAAAPTLQAGAGVAGEAENLRRGPSRLRGEAAPRDAGVSASGVQDTGGGASGTQGAGDGASGTQSAGAGASGTQGAGAGTRATGGAGARARRDAGELRGEVPTPEGPVEAPRIPSPQGWTGLMLRGDRAPKEAGPRLTALGDGRLLHDAGGFTATIAADGSVAFKDVMVKPKVVVMGFDLTTGKFERGATSGDAFSERAVQPFGPSTAAMLAGVSVGMPGLADMLLKHRFARAKLRFLRETEALRMRMAHAWLQARLAEELDRLVARMLAIWRDDTLTLAERRRRIFVAWDECEEGRGTPGSPAEEIRAAAARRARDRIERLVRLIAPPGSPQQFTPAELVRLNAGRRSEGRFAPYSPRE